MRLTRHFVFVHVPKTGGSFVNSLLDEHAPPEWQLQALSDHATHEQIPASHRELPRFAIVRNPFAWHVSWFHFQQAQAQSEFFQLVSDGGRRTFQETMRFAYGPGGPLAESSGALTQTLLEMLGQGLEGARLGRMENLREDLLRLFGDCVALPPAFAAAIRDVPKRNTSKHAHYSSYYDDELRQLIEQRERPVLEHFGYHFETAP